MTTFRKKKLIRFDIVIVAVLAFAYYIFFLPNYYHDPKGELVTISRGASFRMVADSLVSTGAIRNKWSFELAGRILGYTKSIKIGLTGNKKILSNFDGLRITKYSTGKFK